MNMRFNRARALAILIPGTAKAFVLALMLSILAALIGLFFGKDFGSLVVTSFKIIFVLAEALCVVGAVFAGLAGASDNNPK